MLGWFFYLRIACKDECVDKLCESYSGNFKFLLMLEKKLFRIFATSTVSDVIVSLFTKIIYIF